MKIPNHRKLVMLSALLFAGGTAQAADASSATVGTDVASTTVSYADLNLASQSGVATLYRRLARAADQVCGDREARSLREFAAFRECRAASLNRAVQQIGHPGVVALHSGESAARGRS
jgi:UrcA family protein